MSGRKLKLPNVGKSPGQTILSQYFGGPKPPSAIQTGSTVASSATSTAEDALAKRKRSDTAAVTLSSESEEERPVVASSRKKLIVRSREPSPTSAAESPKIPSQSLDGDVTPPPKATVASFTTDTVPRFDRDPVMHAKFIAKLKPTAAETPAAQAGGKVRSLHYCSDF